MTAGSFLNQACVDDGASAADKVCADVTTPRKSLSITKMATEIGYSKVGMSSVTRSRQRTPAR